MKKETCTSSPEHLIWIDLEMTGLNPEVDRILEVAVLITDPQLAILAEFGPIAIYQPPALFAKMDKWCQQTHTKSGLWGRVVHATVSEAEVERLVLDFLSAWVPEGISPMCGNTVSQDRRFLVRYMPTLEKYFHYRSIDVSTLKELAKRWDPAVFQGFKKEYPHQAMEDIRNSVQELAYYRENFLKK